MATAEVRIFPNSKIGRLLRRKQSPTRMVECSTSAAGPGVILCIYRKKLAVTVIDNSPLAIKICKLRGLRSFPAQGHYHLVDQLRRASLSISLNIAEGNGRWHVKDRKNFWWIARGSVFRVRTAVGALQTREINNRRHLGGFESGAGSSLQMLTALIKGTDRRQ
jgi:four helix bundle protein